ncbi:MAG: hypothetical protein KDD70_13140 [Bdellovibrionales bacterium]|nr:hypothetical protein [Bdellovibrionales bacterium]
MTSEEKPSLITRVSNTRSGYEVSSIVGEFFLGRYSFLLSLSGHLIFSLVVAHFVLAWFSLSPCCVSEDEWWAVVGLLGVLSCVYTLVACLLMAKGRLRLSASLAALWIITLLCMKFSYGSSWTLFLLSSAAVFILNFLGYRLSFIQRR